MKRIQIQIHPFLVVSKIKLNTIGFLSYTLNTSHFIRMLTKSMDLDQVIDPYEIITDPGGQKSYLSKLI